MVATVFEWDRHNVRKIKAHPLTWSEVEGALSRDPILIYEQDAEGESVSFTMARLKPTG